MSVVDLINVPKNDQDWEQFLFNHRDSHDRIRKAIQNSGGTLTDITITNGGSGYNAIPDIAIIGGSGFGGSLNITITGGVITSLTIANGGLQYVNPIVTISGGGGSGATATATAATIINLSDYIIYPVRREYIKDFLTNNQSLHTDMNGILGLQSSNLEDVDFTKENERDAWFYSHYKEHFDAENALGI